MTDQPKQIHAFQLFSESITERPTVQYLNELPVEDYSHHLTIQLANFPELSMTHVSIRPGQQHPEHTHECPHVAYVLDGEGIFSVGDRQYPVRRGAFVIIPSGVLHYARNTGTEQLDYIQGLVPPITTSPAAQGTNGGGPR